MTKYRNYRLLKRAILTLILIVVSIISVFFFCSSYKPPLQIEQRKLKNIIEAYMCDQKLEDALEKILQADIILEYFKKRSLKQQIDFRDHVFLLEFSSLFKIFMRRAIFQNSIY